MYLDKYTATMMAAAMAALPGMFPAPSHGATGNEGAPDELTFVSLSPELYEIPPSTVISDKNTKGEPMDMLGEKTQLFYAEPEKEGQTSTVAALSGTKMALVAKRKGVPVTEAGGKSLKFCWGRLDNLIATQQVDMWHRPSASFFSMCFSYAEEGTPQVKGTSKYKLVPGSYQDQIDDKRLKTAKEKLKAAPLSVSFDDDMFTKVIDFKECPWFAMLRRENNSKSNTSLSDQKAVEKYRDKIKDVTQPAEGKKTIDKREYPHWIDYTKQGAKSAIGLRTGRSTWSLVAEGPLKALNLAATSNGDKYPVFGEWLYLGASFWHRDDYRHKQKKDDTHTYYHLLPISGAVFSESDFDAANKLLSLGKQKEEPTITEGRTKIATSIDVPIAKAVILAPEDKLFKRKVFLLGIMADWHSENAGNDALSLNTCCKPNGGHTHPVRIPEIANTDFANLHILRQEIPYLLPRITWVDKEGIGQLLIDRPQGGEAEVRWPNGAKKIKLSEGWCDPIAYQAGARNRQLKLIVALPSYQYASKSLNELGIGKRPTTGERYSYEWKLKCKAKKNKAQSQPQGGQDWASFTPLNYEVAFNRNPRFKIIPGAEDITVVRGDEEYPGYSLYEVTVTADTAINERITAGFMEHDWTFSLYNNGQPYTHNDSPIEFALHSEMPDVYTIFGPSTFGPSTWPDNGMISSTPETQQSAVLPWKDALDVLCKQILCDANSKRKEVKHNAAAKIVMEALHEGVSCLPIYPEDTKTHNRFAYENPTKTKSVATYKISLALSGGIVNKPMVCSDVACLFAILPRICGSTHIVEVKQRFNPTRPKDALDRRHTYNVYDGQNFDATPWTTKDLNSWESRKRKEEPGQIEKENPDCTYYGNFQILLDYVSKTKK